MRRFYNTTAAGGCTPDTPMTPDDLLACWAAMGAKAANAGLPSACRLALPNR